MVSGGADNTVRIWNASSGQQLQQLNGHTSHVYSVAFSPDTKLVVSGGADKTVRIWDTNSGQQLQQLNGHTNQVNSVRFLPNARHVASLGHDNTVRLWDTSSGQQLQQLPANGVGGWSEHLSFCADGKYLAAPAADYKVRVWHFLPYHQLNLTDAKGLPPQTLQALQQMGAVVNQADNDDQKEE